MAALSIRQLNDNLSAAIARAEAGEVITVTRHGRPVVELRARSVNRTDDPVWREAYARMMLIMEDSVDFGGPATYEERTGR